MGRGHRGSGPSARAAWGGEGERPAGPALTTRPAAQDVGTARGHQGLRKTRKGQGEASEDSVGEVAQCETARVRRPRAGCPAIS